MPPAVSELIDGQLIEFFRGPVSALLGSADQLHVPDATRVSGLAALDGRRVRVLIATDAREARANTTVGAAVALLVTDITTYRSIQFKGRVTVGCQERTAGDVALLHRHVETFCRASAQVGLDPLMAPRVFPDDVVALVLEVDTLFDQTPGPGAGRRIEGAQ